MNMLIEMNLDQKTYAKIKKLLENGIYEDEKQVISRAIDNLYERTISLEPEMIGLDTKKEVTVRDVIDSANRFDNPTNVEEIKALENMLWKESKVLDPKIAYVALKELLEKYPHVKNEKWTSELELLKSQVDTELYNHGYAYENIRNGFSWSELKHDPARTGHIAVKVDRRYGPEYNGLIWRFHNRFFPIKFILDVFAYMLITLGKDSIPLSLLKNVITREVHKFSSKLKLFDFENDPKTGFPSSYDEFYDKPACKKIRVKKRRKEKAERLEKTSLIRFLDQFLGRETLRKIESGEDFQGAEHRWVTGACFEMGLIEGRFSDDGNPEYEHFFISLTELGKKFVSLENPIFSLTNTENPNQRKIKDIFSKEESDLIFKEIVPIFPLEEMVMMEFLSQKNELSVTRLTEIFVECRTKFLEENPTSTYVKPDENAEILATTIMRRLQEIGLVNRRKEKLQVFYSVK